jgi:O-antigen/teichoic acid export membrane protein
VSEAAAQPLGAQARRALGWSMLNNVVGRAGTTLMGIVLARILVPEDYGVYAVALVALNALLSMNELGVSLAIIRWPKDVSRIAPTVMTLALGFSAALWIITFFAAPAIADALNAPAATPILRVLTASILIDAATAVPAALMTRDFMQRERMIVDTAGFLVASATAIALAVAGQGAWSLVWSVLLGNIVNGAFILWYAPHRHRPGFKRDIARELLAFGLPLALASLLVFALLNAGYVIVGAELGPKQLGFYLLAFNLSTWPVNMFSTPARRISLPLFARLNAGETEASAAFAPVCSMLLLVTLPACLLLAVFAEPIIRVVYSDKWLPAAHALPWLMVLALTRVLGELAYDFLVALGASRSNLVVQALWLGALVPACLLGVQLGGIQGVAIANAAVAVGVVVPAYAVVLRRAGVSLRTMAAELSRPLTGGLLAGAAGLAVVLLVPGRIVQLAVGAACVALVYVVVVYPMRAVLRASAVGSA